MCKGGIMSTVSVVDNKKELENENENADEGLQDVELSVALNDEAEAEAVDAANSLPKSSEPPQQQQQYPWWKGGGSIPQSGKDLGVMEASLEDRASCFGLWWMAYLDPLLALGARKILDSQDVGIPSQQDRADRAYTKTKAAWDEQVELCKIQNELLRTKYQHDLTELQKKKKQTATSTLIATGMATEEGEHSTEDVTTDADDEKLPPPVWQQPSVASALIRSFGKWKIGRAIIYQIISALLTFVPVLILNDLVRYFEWHTLLEISPDPASIPPFQGMAPPWVEVVGLGLIPLLVSLLQTRHNAIMAHCGVFVRTAVSTLLYRKALTVSAAGRAKTSTGQVVNMMSNDTMQLQRFLQFIGMTMIAPLQIIISLVLIYQQVGNAMWVGVAYMVFLMPINMWVFGVVGKMRRKVLKHSDSRVKMMNEILTGIRIIKFYAWERPFGKEVSTIRGKEMDALTKMSYTVAVGFSIILLSTPIVQPIFVFVTYVNIQSEPLTASTAFTTVALFNLMRFPFAFMPMGLLQFIQSRISMHRLERYLALPELKQYVLSDAPPSLSSTRTLPRSNSKNDLVYDLDKDMTTAATADKSGSITIIDGSFGWIDPEGPVIQAVQEEERSKKKEKLERKKAAAANRRASLENDEGGGNGRRSSLNRRSSFFRRKSDTTVTTEGGMSDAASAVTDESVDKLPVITLRNINLHIQPGSLVAVVGSVGSGKSSLLSAILGEMESIHDSKVYVPRPTQHEQEMDGFASYCTQSPWVVNATLRDNILFGRTFNQERYTRILSVSALQDDIDILPAGDKTEIGERGINLSGGQKARVSLARALYSSETRLLLLDDPLSAVDAHVGEHLFTHAIEGEISKGKTRILVTHHVHILSRCDSVIMMENGTIKHQGSYQELIDQGVDFAGAVDVSKMNISSEPYNDAKGTDGDDAMTKVDSEKKTSEKDGSGRSAGEDKAAQKKAGTALVTEEERAEGDVATDAYIRYARAGGWCIAILTILIQALGRTFEILSTFWLALWADRMLEAEELGVPFTKQETSFYVGIFGLFGLLSVLGLGFRGIFLAMHRLKASQQLHDGLSNAIMRAPVSFFDVTPIGRILNRFAADMDKIDLELTQTVSQGINTIFQVLGALGAILVATKGTFIVVLIPLGYFYYLVQKWFRKTSTELQRVTNVANSPIFADFSQTLSGTSSIRAYGVQQGFFTKCKSSFDNMNASYILVQLASYWLALRLDVMGGLIGMFIGALSLATLPSGFIPAGWLGLALSYAIEVTAYLKYGVQMIARLEADMSSVERILYYTDNIEPEAPDVIPDKDPQQGTWPVNGEIELSHASMRYRDGPLVLKDVSFTVKGGEKIGVCGRTGSGKSSLMIALFRISELEKDNGCLTIDGVNIGDIGTAALRSNISIIPQDPVMFSNTVRYNLDPFADKSDDELWDVLKKVEMGEAIAILPNGLDDVVAEGGENFSQGQRQLLCIARSLLRKPKILVMDEATASIDNETDATIQRMIRENFTDATVLTIAHRLNTIMDSDRILVLDDGKIVELDSPENLMLKESGHFKSMVEKSRSTMDLLQLSKTAK